MTDRAGDPRSADGGRGDGSARGERSDAAEERLDRARELLTAAVDDELDPQERRELEGHLEGDPALRKEWEAMSELKEITDRMRLEEPPEEVWEGYWAGVYRRLERGIGWILISVGAVLLLAYGAFEAVDEILSDPALPGFVKVGAVALALGVVVLLVSVVREKIFVWKRDPYKDVRR